MHVLNMPITLSQQADVYALGVILKELICLNRPYAEQNRTPKGWLCISQCFLVVVVAPVVVVTISMFVFVFYVIRLFVWFVVCFCLGFLFRFYF